MGHAAPIDGAVDAHQRDGMQIPDDSVILDGQVIVGRVFHGAPVDLEKFAER